MYLISDAVIDDPIVIKGEVVIILMAIVRGNVCHDGMGWKKPVSFDFF